MQHNEDADRLVPAQATLQPFRTIWTRPRETIRHIVGVNPALYVALLAGLAGLDRVLDRAASRDAGDTIPMPYLLGLAVVLGPVLGWGLLWFYAYLVQITGRWLGGAGELKHLVAALAWASVPNVCALALWIPLLLLFGEENFTEATPRMEAEPWLLLPGLAIALIDTVLGIWTFVLACNTVAEVQGYRSAWRGLGNVLLVLLPILLAVLASSLLAAA